MLPMGCGAVGIEAESDKIELLLKEVDGKDVNELITSGMSPADPTAITTYSKL